MRSSSSIYVSALVTTNTCVCSQLHSIIVNKNLNGLNSRIGLKFVAVDDLYRICDVALYTY